MAALALAVAASIAARPVEAADLAPAADHVPSDLQFILSEAQRVQEADVAAWASYRFRRRAEHQDIGDAGEIEEQEVFEFLVTPQPGGFDEELLRLDDREPLADERDRHRKLGSFGKHYRTLMTGVGNDEIEGGYSLGLLLHLASYRYAGLEDHDGVACYRLDFFPDEAAGPKEKGLAWKVARVMKGSLWIAREGFHVAAARAETVRPISLALSLAKVSEVEVSVVCAPVGEGIWLPRRIEMRTRARVLLKSMHRRNLYAYSDFLRQPPPG
ncbi:MAG TPA: hypothetical protein VGV60_11395 [Candidatus Polarisedimenticolia bacterium]|nr:hypothetical protein [Candidatus Polarisedimenticolia bacterium]